MSIIDKARDALNKVKEDLWSSPWTFQPLSPQNQNSDYTPSKLYDEKGEAIIDGLPDSVGELVVLSPEMAEALDRVANLADELEASGEQMWRSIYPHERYAGSSFVAASRQIREAIEREQP